MSSIGPMKAKIKYYSLPILSGFLIGTSYIPFPPWALLFCIAPLWLFWNRETSYKKIFFAGWLTQFILNGIGFHWIAHTATQYGQLPMAVGVVILLLFCILAHLYYPIAGVLWKWLSCKLQLSELASLLLLPFVFVFCERLYPFIFYWHFGYPWLWAGLPGYQLTDIIGFFGLNTLTLFINVLFVLFWLRRSPKQWLHPYLIAAVGSFVAINLLGLWRASLLPPPDQKTKILMVQANIGNYQKIQAAFGVRYVGETVDRYLDLTRRGLDQHPDTELILWPETAFPETLYPNSFGRQRRRLAELSDEFGIQILTGAYEKKQYRGQVYNTMVLMEGNQILHSYPKSILLAFGEYLPFAQYYPKAKKWFPMVSDFGRGPGPETFQTRHFKAGPQICYEGLFDTFSTDLQKKGAQIFVNITNDSWFGYPFEPYQHLYMTLARSIENRRPMVRVTNTGISTAILANGDILEHSPREQEWYGAYDIPFHSTPPATFYANLSDKWPLVLLVIMALIVIGDRFARPGKH